MATEPYVYRVQYVAPGGRSRAVTYESDMPLEEGSWLAIDGVYLVVERLIAGKRGDPYVAVALCKLTVG